MYNPHYGTVRLQADATAGCGGGVLTMYLLALGGWPKVHLRGV